MVRVHVGMNLKYKTGEFLFFRPDGAFFGFPGKRCRSYFDEAIQKFPDTEIIQRRTEKYGSYMCVQVFLPVETGINPLNQLQVFP